MGYKLIFILILAGLAVIFIVQNVAVVEIQFLFWSISAYFLSAGHRGNSRMDSAQLSEIPHGQIQA